MPFRCRHNTSAYLSPAGSGQCWRTGLRGHRNRPADQVHFEENEASHEHKNLLDVFTYHPQPGIRIIDLQRSHDSISNVFFKGMWWRHERHKPNVHLDVGGEGEEHRHEQVAGPPDEAEQRLRAFRLPVFRNHFSRSKGSTNPPGLAGCDGAGSEASFGRFLQESRVPGLTSFFCLAGTSVN